MSFIQKIFGGQPAPQVIPGNNPMNNPAPAAPLATDKTAPNGVLPNDANKTVIQEEKKEVSPLEQFKDMWNPPVVDPNKEQDQSNVEITPAQFMEAAGKIDFTKAIPQDLHQKIIAGGEEGQKAFLEAMNKVTQISFGQSMTAAQKIIDRKSAALEEKFQKQVPQAIKSQSVHSALMEKNPGLAHPAVQPVITAVQKQLADLYPKASESELREKAEAYITNLGMVFNPAKEVADTKQQQEDKEDWFQLLGVDGKS